MKHAAKRSSLVMLPALAGLAACNPAGEGTETVSVAITDATGNVHLTIQDESGDGTYESPAAGMPEGFPADFPIPAGVMERSNRLLVGGKAMWSMVVQTQADYTQTIGFFQRELPAAGWTVTGTREAQMDWGTSFFIRVSAPDASVIGAVTIEDREEGASVTLNLSEGK
jgi:hypothetical protein